MTLSVQRCALHPAREAAARCPACGGFFCRECVTEHDGRVLCSSCLRAAAKRPESKAGPWMRRLAGASGRALVLLASFLVAWLAFFALGQFLVRGPSVVHSGAMWGGKK